MKFRLVKFFILIVAAALACILGTYLQNPKLFAPSTLLAPIMLPQLLVQTAPKIWPCGIFLLILITSSVAFVTSRVSVRWVFIPALFFAILPFVILTAWSNEYGLRNFPTLISSIVAILFVVYCWRKH